MNKLQILIKQLTNSTVVLFLWTVNNEKAFVCLCYNACPTCEALTCVYCHHSYKTRKRLQEFTFLKETILKNS